MKKFLSGEVGLATAYWLITLPCYAILAGLAVVIQLKPKEPATLAWVAGWLFVTVITSIGLWKSATNYAGFALWKYLVKLGCILSFGVVGAFAFLAVTDGIKSLMGTKLAAETFRYDVFNTDDNCKRTSTTPAARVEFLPNDERREVYMRVLSYSTAQKNLVQLEHCTYMDTKNWSCGGDVVQLKATRITNSVQKMIAGEFSFEMPKYSPDYGTPVCSNIYRRIQ